MGHVTQRRTRCLVHLIGDRTEWWIDSDRPENGAERCTPQAYRSFSLLEALGGAGASVEIGPPLDDSAA